MSGISPLIPILFLSLIFLYSSVALLPQVGLLLGWSQQIQYSGLENSMHCIVHGIANSWTWLSNFTFILQLPPKKKKTSKAWERKKIVILVKINHLYTWEHIEVEKESCIQQITSFVWPECQDVRLENYTVLCYLKGSKEFGLCSRAELKDNGFIYLMT